MRRFVRIPLRLSTSYSCLILKIISVIILLYGVLRILEFGYASTTNINTKVRSLADMPSYSSWHCELDKRMIKELQKEIRDKDRLLKYRGKVIAKLRVQIHEINKTKSILKHTLLNLTDVIVPLKSDNVTEQKNKTFYSTNSKKFIRGYKFEPEFPENLKEKVDRVARPCCIALKRMTDILRLYMETTQDLKDQIEAFRMLNITEKMEEYAEREKRKFAALNCSERFRLETANISKKPEKHSLYQTYRYGKFYETTPLNRILPVQKFKSKSYHRNIDFAKAVNIGLQELLRETKLPRNHFEMNEGLLHYGELRGAEYELTFLYNKTRTFSVNLLKPFGPHILSEKITEETLKYIDLVNIIVPLSEHTYRLVTFLDNIRHIVQNKQQNIFLTVVIYGKDLNNDIKNTIKKFSKENNFKNYDIFKKNIPFNRGRALHDGIKRWNGYPNVIMFLCDIDIKFDVEFLNRCRRNTKLGKSIYMPVLYSLYNPKVVFGENYNYTEAERFNITEATGTWRPLGHGMVCVYKPDYISSRGFNLKINGWGGEDISLYYRFLRKGIKVIRAPDPNLFHAWHPKHCSPSLHKKQYIQCIGSKARYEGSQRQLGIQLFLKNSTSNSV